MIYLVVMLVVVIAALVIALQNPLPMAMTFIFWHIGSTVAGVILVAFVLGLVFGVCMMFPILMKMKKKNKDLVEQLLPHQPQQKAEANTKKEEPKK